MLENLAIKGFKQQGVPDIRTIKMTHPEVLYGWGILCVRRGESGLWMATETMPDSILSGYRDNCIDPDVNVSAHWFAAALDVMVSRLNPRNSKNWSMLLEEQINVVKDAVRVTQIFKRGGLYPMQNSCHLDICDDKWMERYKGTRFWVKHKLENKMYHGFDRLTDAAEFARAAVKEICNDNVESR